MQEKIRPSEEFSRRTDELAEKLGVSLRGLVAPMDMSKASLFGYRNGSIPVSGKAWSKLERAERAAQSQPPTANRQPPSRVQETPSPPGYCPELGSWATRIAAMEARLERIEGLLGKLVNRTD